MTQQLLVAEAVLVASGLLALVGFSSRRWSTAIASLGGLLACAIGGVAAVRVLQGGSAPTLSLAWPEPVGTLVVGADALSALFLVPLFGLGGVASVYGRGYLLHSHDRRSLATPSLFFNVLIASMALVLVARTTILFLFAWEMMALSSWFLVTLDHQNADVRRAGWIYLVAGHVGVASLLALFLILGSLSGGLEFAGFHTGAAAAPVGLVFALAVVGFGIKAGFVPLHVWLPEAHAAAPSHVSAVMSGVMIKVGLYGFLRTLTFIVPAWWCGPVLMAFGLLGGFLGILLALYQRDLKRVLAYSSIENMGIILLGLGLGLWGAFRGELRVAALGFAGGFLHVWTHAIMKGLLFLSAGSVHHATGTRDIEHLGGLLRRMRWTGATMIVGSGAIAGLPPFAGFVGEWLIYLGLLHRGATLNGDGGNLVALFVVAGLALIGALAVLCFVRLVGIVLLGSPRRPAAEAARESSPWLTIPMAFLALLTIVVAFVPGRVILLQSAAIDVLVGAGVSSHLLSELALLTPLVRCNAAVWVLVALLVAILTAVVDRRRGVDDTWGCGYAQPTPRMQYSGSSFAQILTASLIPGPLRPIETVAAPTSLFPLHSVDAGCFTADAGDPLTRGIYQPFFTRWADRFARLRWFQRGLLHLYLLYILLVVVVALAWSSISDWIGT